MEQNENIGPIYAFRLKDLRRWHRVSARCFQCCHETVLLIDLIRWDRPEHTRLVDLERKLRCTKCGNRERNTISVRMVER